MFVLGERSLRELQGVHPALIQVVEEALRISPQDFAVVDGLRTPEEQAVLVRKGASQTTNSKHLVQPDGFGHAVDLVPVEAGKPRWEWPLIFPIARAVREAARSLGVPLRWGGSWERLDDSDVDPEVMVAEYVARRLREGRKAFTDGPHYELLGL